MDKINHQQIEKNLQIMKSLESLDAGQLTVAQRYSQCLQKIYSWGVFRNRQPALRHTLSLQQMHTLCSHFDNPHKGTFKVIHVAGTNGKGSVSIKTAHSLQAMGYRVGLFISPHISTFRERFQIDGECVSVENIVETCERIFHTVEQHDLDVRFFEIITLIGFIEFKRAGCDYVVLECGLGARLDATNVVNPPDVICSVITSIGMDHMDVLGDTLDDITTEKAAVIKADCTTIIGPTCKGQQPIYDRANEVNAQLIEIEKQATFGEDNNKVVEAILNVVSEKENVEIKEEIISQIQHISQPCRFERVANRSETILMDVCHNIDGFQAVLQQIKTQLPEVTSIRMVFGISKSKKLDEIINLLENEPLVQDIHLVSRPHMRLYKVEDAQKIINDIGCQKLQEPILEDDNNIKRTLDHIVSEMNEEEQMNRGRKQLLLICGSFFIMSDVKQYFGYEIEVDQIM